MSDKGSTVGPLCEGSAVRSGVTGHLSDPVRRYGSPVGPG